MVDFPIVETNSPPPDSPETKLERLRAALVDASPARLRTLCLMVETGLLAPQKVAVLAVALAGVEPSARLAPLALAVLAVLGTSPGHHCPHGADCPGAECSWVD